LYLFRGDIKKLKNSMKKQLLFLEKPQFDDSFKGIFGPFVYNEKDVQSAKELISELVNAQI
jgi:hypothetical protein